jgi:hypothetical protein
MAQLNAFNAALIHCGFNADTADAITNKGFDTLETLADMEEDDIDSMIKNTRCTLIAQAQGNVTFPFLAICRFKAMHSWATELRRTGRILNTGLFTGALITTAVMQHSLESMHAMTTKDKDIDKPKELTNLTNWEKFWE